MHRFGYRTLRREYLDRLVLVANEWLPHSQTGADLARTLIFGITNKIRDDILAEFSPDLKRFCRKIWKKIHP